MSHDSSTDGRAGIDAGLVRRLIAEQFPQWADLSVRPVAMEGWDNRTYHLGSEMTVRLPTAEGYAAAIEKEHRWLPHLAPGLPVPIPESQAMGDPTPDYPHHWSVRGWLPGETANAGRVDDHAEFARSIAGFIRALHTIDTTDGPAPGGHCFHRGGPPAYYDDETRLALKRLEGRIDTDRAEDVWDTALRSTWAGAPVWFHGDIAHGNLLVRDGRLAAVIDFGTSGVGDPACDLVIAWTFFSDGSREEFRTAVDQDADTWARARGWAIWKALIVLAEVIDSNPEEADINWRVIDAVIADHDRWSNGV